MNDISTTQTRTVTVERKLPFAPEKVWRALTQPHLIEEWLMKNDFEPEVGRRFELKGDWGTVDCRVLSVETGKSLSYTWEAMGLKSTVVWTLIPDGDHTQLRMEQSGFRIDQEQAYQGAQYGWQRFLDRLEPLLART